MKTQAARRANHADPGTPRVQHRPLRVPLSYLVTGYARNPYEEEASRAVEQTRS